MSEVKLTPEDKAEMEAWYVETRDRNWAEEEQWTAEEYFIACQCAHYADQIGASI